MRICLLSLSQIANDPRVRRQGDALMDAGHDVVGIGLSGSPGPPPTWTVIEIPGLSPSVVTKARMAVGGLTGGRLRQPERAFWSFPLNRAFLAATPLDADVYVANDWRMLPVAASAAERASGRYVYDSHEYAAEEGADRRLWRWLFQDYARQIESTFIGGASFVSTVGEGISDLLQRAYGLEKRPLVIRNTPAYREMPYRDPGDVVTVLYHGIFASDRCLHELIESVADWKIGTRLVLRGFGKPGIEASLRKAAASSPASQRIEFAPPVPMLDLVEKANEADIGVFVTPATTNHTRFCLPNKLFEYVMAGLALCVSDTAEMGALVRDLDLGVLLAAPTADALADAINKLTVDELCRYKRRSLDAAHQLCWDREASVLVAAFADLERKD